MTSYKCPKCGRLLGKIDQDGVLHIRMGKDGPQVFLDLNQVIKSALMLVCPSQVFTPNGRVHCGSRNTIGAELLN